MVSVDSEDGVAQDREMTNKKGPQPTMMVN
jgi:hypothetical protein